MVRDQYLRRAGIHYDKCRSSFPLKRPGWYNIGCLNVYINIIFVVEHSNSEPSLAHARGTSRRSAWEGRREKGEMESCLFIHPSSFLLHPSQKATPRNRKRGHNGGNIVVTQDGNSKDTRRTGDVRCGMWGLALEVIRPSSRAPNTQPPAGEG